MIITAAGRAVIADEDAALGFGDSVPAFSEPDVSASPPATSKIAHVFALLQREQGATLDELVAATGWLPHTTRSALTGLRKKGQPATFTAATLIRIDLPLGWDQQRAMLGISWAFQLQSEKWPEETRAV